MGMDIEKRWSLLKQAILNHEMIRGTDVEQGYKDLFATLDLNLSGQLRKVSKAADAAGKKQDPASRARFRQELLNAADILTQYKQQLQYLKEPFLAKYQALGVFQSLETNLNRIESDVLAAAAALA
jgi:hypothetical protein